MTSPEVDQELERLFSVTREATQPDGDARARIRAGLDARLAAGAGTAPAVARGKHWFGIGAAVVGIGAAILWYAGSRPSSAPAVAAKPADVQAQPGLVAEPAPVVASTPVAEPAVAAAPVSEPPTVAEARKPKPQASVAAANSAAPDPAEEITLVRAMQQALRSGNASQALALAGEHARRFPKGALIEEREGARAVARCQLAQPEARTAILEGFSKSFGASPYAARVKAACQ